MTMIIALASPRVAASAEECLERIERSISEAATRGAEIVCFPEELQGLPIGLLCGPPVRYPLQSNIVNRSCASLRGTHKSNKENIK
jgi:hypothetical protein